SPYIAAFFAFRDAATKVPKRSICVYCETPGGFGKGGAVGEAAMRRIGPYVKSHPRHFRQLSDYTMCASFDAGAGWRFHPHDPVFFGRDRSDFVWKFNLPSTERIRILRLLDDYTLNAY